MAQYDGSIRIGTGIDTSGIKKGAKQLEKDIKDLADAQKSFLEAGGTKESPVYKDYEKRIKKLQSAIESLQKAQEQTDTKNNHWNQLKIDVEEYEKTLKELQSQGKFFGDEEYDKVYLAWKNATDAVKEYQSELNKQSASGQAKIADQEAKAAEKREAAQRRVEEQAEKALQKENARIQKEVENQAKLEAKEAERQAKIQEEAAEEERLAQIRENAVVGNQRIVEVVERRKQVLQEIADLEKAGVGAGYQQYDSAKQELASLDGEIRNYNNNIDKVKENYKKLADSARKSFSAIGNLLKKANSTVDSLGRKIKEIAQRHMPSLRKETEKTGSSFSKFNSRLKSLLSGIFIFNVISSGFRKMFSGIGDGFKNFYSESSAFSSSIDNMRQSLSYLQNSFAAAFAPIVEIAIPYIQKLIGYMSSAVNAIAQFIAALFGKKTYTKAVGTATKAMDSVGSTALKSNKAIGNTSSALNNVADSAREARDALEGYLSPLDEINKYKTDKGNSSFLGNISGGGVQNPSIGSQPGNAAGDQFGEYFENMFEEIPVDSIFEKMAEKVKDVLSKLFAPLKEAWNREGKFVMDSWKSALKEVWNLVKSVGSDFLEVWQQEKTIKIFEDILHIVGDIGQAVKNLAYNFRMAWEENETGKRILEGVRDVIGVIVANIRHAADATVEWAKNIDFRPLLTKMQQWIASMVPVMDNLSGIVTDFYEHVLLPLGKWVLEKGLPDLLQVFIDFNNKVDWEALRARLAEFWEHLEPFAEKVGEGLIIFIERVSSALADFINSPAFESFLTMIENWMDNVSPEEVANALETIAKTIIGLKSAVSVWGAMTGPIQVIGQFFKLISALKGGKMLADFGSSASTAAGGMKAIGETAGFFGKALDTSLLSMGAFGLGYQGLKQISKNSNMDEAFKATTETLKLLKKEFDNGSITMEEYEAEREKLNNANLQVALKGDEESLSSLNSKLKETRDKFNLTEKTIDNFGSNSVSSINKSSSGIKTEWSNLWSSMQGNMSSNLEIVKNGLQSALEWILEKIKSIKNAISGLFDSNKSTGGFGKGSSFFPFSAPRLAAVNPVLEPLANAPIPRLATGAVIPANKEFLAVLGDQKHGTNIEAPLDTIKQAQRESLLEIFSELGLTGNKGTERGNTYNIKAMAHSKVLFELMIEEGKLRQMSTGNNPFLLGTT